MKVQIKDMTFVEFRERMAEKPVVVIPLGSQEEQGPHAPMGDYMLSEKLAELVGRQSGALVAPTIPFGYADVFRCVPGGVQLRASTFCALLEDAISAFLDHGMRHIVLFNGHTGNTALIAQTVHRFKASHRVIIPSINIWKAIPASLWRQLHGEIGERAGGHGADPITSVYQYFFPDLMRPDLVKQSDAKKAFGLATIGLSGVEFSGCEILVPLDVLEVNECGLIGGDANLSSAEIGKAFTDHIVAHASGFVRHFRNCDPSSFIET